MIATNWADLGLWYRVRHPQFDYGKLYRAIEHTQYGETAWHYFTFITEAGFTWCVRVDRCQYVCTTEDLWAQNPGERWWYSPLTDEKACWPKPVTPKKVQDLWAKEKTDAGYNPDLIGDQ